MRCKQCNRTDFQLDEDTGNPYCSGCGTIPEYDNYVAQIGGINGPQGTYIQVGRTGIGHVLAYKEKKVYEAKNLIEVIAERLNLGTKSEEVKSMIEEEERVFCLWRRLLMLLDVIVGGESQLSCVSNTDDDELSAKQLCTTYKEFDDGVRNGTIVRRSEENDNSSRSVFQMVPCEDWWKGKSKMSQRLPLKEVLEKDVGLEALPPYLKWIGRIW
ncbi:unnamed protein product [Microthlaspi erraticum]|uniref:TFIIB-type domain-containing protein n=1 Tax=Microthlaspi erraticum TaxID=1685480 RepID=A0A6D2J2H0_9BRAS|nr:unnamed protein product [Microthlaspi erraticum]